MSTEKYEGLEVVAYQSIDATRGGGWMAHKHALPQAHIDQGALQEPLCRLSDAQRAIAELRDQLLKAAEQSLKATELLSATLSERDTLRQQLAERDAQIASMRAEVTPFIETHWMPVARQRDKLAELLDEVTDDFVVNYLDADLIKRIDAALDEVNKWI